MPIKKLRPNFSFTQDRIEQLKAVVPEAFADGKINFDSLREALGEYLEDQGHPEAEHGSTELAEVFGLFWPGKREARRLATLPSKGTLVPAPGEGIDEDKTCNIFIEGENLEVLKLLQKSYAGRIKMIYIDPPYNTGNDFVYKDDFKEPLEEYLRRTGQADENGKLLTTNTKASGRFHSNWLNMMYPRLVLARQFLCEDGVLIASIDDNEIHDLRFLLNEVFGEENFIAQLVWKKKYTGGKHAKHYVDLHEYLLVYARRTEALDEVLIDRPENEKLKFELSDEHILTRGKYYIRPLKSNLAPRPTLVYPIVMPDGSQTKTQWMIAPDTFTRFVAEGRIEFRQKRDGKYQVYRKYYENDNDGKVKVPTIIEVSSNNDAKAELKDLFQIEEGRENVFYTAKPSDLFKYLFKPLLQSDDFLLDFFAGSCSTAHAVMDLNREDGGNRRFIMVQLPEPTPEDSPACKAGYATIAEIGKERIRRVIAKMKKEANGNSKAKRETPEDLDKLGRVDLGFKVFKLARSNFKAWQDYDGESIQELETLFDQAATPLVKGWKEDDLLTEIMLQQGFPLDSKIARQSGFKSNKVQLIESEACSHRLFVCLDPKIKEDTIKHLELRTEDIFVCLDSAITDQAKMRLADICRLDII
ncbi:site-specific DNA-methyltransferase [bacterium]|nr:site-specific DNA-methyltransferase [bacterium]